MSFSFTADDEHCICVRNIQLNFFISVHCQLKGFIPILNCFTFVMERQCGLRSYLRQRTIFEICYFQRKSTLETSGRFY